jgi:LmbE family N-acetylglucosaminyl deacetylase
VLGAALALFYWWQPWEFDVIPRQPPKPNPPVDPDSARLFARGTRITVITAHPDDAEFYLGGTLAKLRDAGAVLSLIVCTDGDKGYYPFEDAARNRRVRRDEQTRAAHQWGANDVVYLSYPDGRLTASDELIAKIESHLQRLKPEYVLAFDGEYPPRRSHADHRRAGDASAIAAPRVDSVKWLLKFSTIAANFYVDITDYWPEKKELLRVHHSQFVAERNDFGNRIVGRTGNPWPFIESLVEGAALRDGREIGVEYAEGLRCILIRK